MEYIPKEKLKARFLSLPDRLQDIILSEETAGVISKAAKFADLEDQVGILAILTGRVLMGFLHPAKFKDALKDELNIDEQTALQISEMISSQVFDFVEPELKKLYPPTIKTPTVQSKGFLNIQDKPKKKKTDNVKKAFFERVKGAQIKKEKDNAKKDVIINEAQKAKEQKNNLDEKKVEQKKVEQKNQVRPLIPKLFIKDKKDLKKDSFEEKPKLLNNNPFEFVKKKTENKDISKKKNLLGEVKEKKDKEVKKSNDIEPVVQLPTFLSFSDTKVDKKDEKESNSNTINLKKL